MRKRSRLSRAIALIAALVIGVPASARADCIVHFVDYNADRDVYGWIDAECSWPRAPFGNWGVDSIHGGRVNGDQFMGWQAHANGTVQWNSCTKDEEGNQYRPPNPSFYNHPVGEWTSQRSNWPDRVFANYYSDVLPWPCTDYGEIYTLNNYFMHLWELDEGGDEDVAWLYYPTINVVLSYSGEYGSGWSGWTTRNGYSPGAKAQGDVVNANIRVFIELIPA